MRSAVLRIGDFSIELCGGTHVGRAGDIGLFKVVSEGGIAAGVRRIEAVTGAGALNAVEKTEATLREVAGLVRGTPDDVSAKVAQLLERNRSLEKEVQGLKGQLATGGARDLLDEVAEVAGIKVLAAQLDGADAKALRDAVDRFKDKLQTGVVVLGTVEGDKVRLAAGVTKDLTAQLHAGKLVGNVAEMVGGKGGGRPDMAQAGGSDPTRLPLAIQEVPAFVAKMLE